MEDAELEIINGSSLMHADPTANGLRIELR